MKVDYVGMIQTANVEYPRGSAVTIMTEHGILRGICGGIVNVLVAKGAMMLYIVVDIEQDGGLFTIVAYPYEVAKKHITLTGETSTEALKKRGYMKLSGIQIKSEEKSEKQSKKSSQDIGLFDRMVGSVSRIFRRSG